MTPDFSPAMLKDFLRARVTLEAHIKVFAAPAGFAPDLAATENEEKAFLRAKAGVTKEQFDLAWTGRNLSLEPREGLWLALGVSPASCGVRLVDLGRQERIALRRVGR